MTYLDNNVQKFTRIDTDGPFVFVRSFGIGIIRTTTSIQNAAGSASSEQAISVVEVNHNVSATPISKVAISAATFSLDNLIKVIGPVFKFDMKNFNENKSVVIPRVTLNATITSLGSFSTYRLKA